MPQAQGLDNRGGLEESASVTEPEACCWRDDGFTDTQKP